MESVVNVANVIQKRCISHRARKPLTLLALNDPRGHALSPHWWHSRLERSCRPTQTRHVPSGENATEFTSSECPSSACPFFPLIASKVCPLNTRSVSPEATCQIRTEPSHDPDTTRVPSGENATDSTQFVCPSSMHSNFQLSVF